MNEKILMPENIKSRLYQGEKSNLWLIVNILEITQLEKNNEKLKKPHVIHMVPVRETFTQLWGPV